MSPDEFEVRYRRAETRFRVYLNEHLGLIGRLLFAFTLWCAAIVVAVLLKTGTVLVDSAFVGIIVHSLIVAIPLALIGLWIPNGNKTLFHGIALLLLWLSADHYILETEQEFWPRLLTHAWLPGMCAVGAMFLSRVGRSHRKWPIRILFLTVFVLSFAAVALILHQSSPEAGRRLWTLKPFFLLFAFLFFSFRENIQSRDALAFAFNPFNGLRGELWPYDFRLNEIPKERLLLWWHGILNLALALGLLFFHKLVETIFPPDSRLLEYFLRIVFDVSAMNLIAGVVRTFGYQVRDATNFVVLAKTPADVWRRGSVYHYLFLLQTVYLPIQYLIRSRLLAVFVTMLFFQVNRFGFSNLVALLAKIFAIHVSFFHKPDYYLYFFGIKYLLFTSSIYITPKFWFISRRAMEFSRKAWLSIILTQIVMVGIDVGTAVLARALAGG